MKWICILLLFNDISHKYQLFFIGSFVLVFCILKNVLSICSVNHWLRGAILSSMCGLVNIFFSHSIINLFFIYFEALLFGTHVFGLLNSLDELTTFIIMEWLSLSVSIFLVLKYVTSEITTAMVALFSLMLLCDILYFINFRTLLYSYLKWVSFR